MLVNIVTLFPEFFQGPLSSGLMQRAVEKGLVRFNFINPRDFTDDKRQTVDDRPYGGGPGMVMLLQPLARALRSLGFQGGNNPAQNPGRLLAMSPKGRPFSQALAAELAACESITLLCGRYEGFDARLGELFPLEEVSLGDFVLNGGESAALAVCEAASRLLPGFMGHDESGLEESFSASLLEYPHFTRPEVFEGLGVPEVLRGGDHAAVARWRRREALAATAKARPELLDQARLGPEDVDYLRDFYGREHKRAGRNLYLALVHYPVLDKDQKNVAVSLTNLDIHDISRSSRTYGLGRFFIVTPLEDQKFVLDKVLEHWVQGAGGQSNPDRKEALSRVTAVNALEDLVKLLEEKHGSRPLLWGSSADYNRAGGAGAPKRRGRRPKRQEDFSGRIISFDEARKILYTRPAVLLLGTGHGLAPEIIEQCDHLLPPLRRFADYNHLSVRSAGTVILDRILGEWG